MAGDEESFRSQTSSDGYPEAYPGPDYSQPDEDFDEDEYYDDEPAAGNPQFDKVYHQPYNQTVEDDRAAYQADYQRTLARRYQEEEEPPEDDVSARVGRYEEPGQLAVLPAQPSPVQPLRRRSAPTVSRTGMSAAPLPLNNTGAVPSQRSPRTSLRDKTPPRRTPQRRPSASARGFVPNADRIATARTVMTYLARRPWLQLDVVDIILGTQFDRDDVAHALIVLQQSGRISSHLRGDRVCYAYAVTENVT
ncbi:hypothetical protein [Kineosporia babensis]|uniref:Uncharacterized protein n=1 Tax=Kineosporia babensis TaxID=499548 RepID=A0A9X1SS11_9ACTN|nr:hypothetical protein [Kineosporia babensis]MCD5310119.1 hypothetical protein [Kineosporia babensis]